MNRIMINGRSCSGKDTMADYLVEKYGYTKIAFATPIYQICRDYFGMTTKDRTLLQAVGEKMREIDPDVWVKIAYKEANKYEKIVISDIRRENEYLLGIKNGFIPFRIHADIEERIQRCVERDGKQPNLDEWENVSEIGADHFVYYDVPNYGSVEELYKLIDSIMEKGVHI